MKTIILHREAERRLKQIRNYSMEEWGVSLTQKYLTGFKKQFENIATNKAVYRIYPALLAQSILYTRYKKHYIFFIEETDRVIILTILHEAMDIPEAINKLLE